MSGGMFLFSMLALTATIMGKADIEVSEIFNTDLKVLSEPLQLSCRNDGDKIKIEDILYRNLDCDSSEIRPQDPASETNRQYVYQCTGKLTCAISSENIRLPFFPRSPSCLQSKRYMLVVRYDCVQRDIIHEMCSRSQAQNYKGYLATPNYPMLLPPGIPIAPCRCHLEATLNSRVVLSILEVNLGIPRIEPDGETSRGDVNACQSENSKQFLQIIYNYGSSSSSHTCKHKYNVDVEISHEYDLILQNPIKRLAGSIWLQYSAEDPNAMVKVTCQEPALTTPSPMEHTEAVYTGDIDYKIILGVVAVSLFIIIIAACVILTIKYRGRMNHYMMYKYSKTNRKDSRHSTQEVNTVNEDNTDEENPEDNVSCEGKPTAHITPHQSVQEQLELKARAPNSKTRVANGKSKSTTFRSSYISDENQKETDQPDRVSQKKKSKKYHNSSSGSESSLTSLSDAPVVPQKTAQSFVPISSPKQSQEASLESKTDSHTSSRTSLANSSMSTTAPMFEDIWLRVNTPDHPQRNATGVDECDSLLTTSLPPIPNLSFATTSYGATTPNPRPIFHSQPAQIFLAQDSRAPGCEEEEMDIKQVQPCIAAISPFRQSKSSSSSNQSNSCLNSPREVTFSPGTTRPKSKSKISGLQPRSSCSLDSMGRGPFLKKSPSISSSPQHFKNPRSPVKQRQFHSTYADNRENEKSKGYPFEQLKVDLPSRSNSLPRRQSVNQDKSDSLYSHLPKRPKRKNATPLMADHKAEFAFYSEPNSPLDAPATHPTPVSLYQRPIDNHTHSTMRKASSSNCSSSALAPLPEDRPMSGSGIMRAQALNDNRGSDTSTENEERILLTRMQKDLHRYNSNM